MMETEIDPRDMELAREEWLKSLYEDGGLNAQEYAVARQEFGKPGAVYLGRVEDFAADCMPEDSTDMEGFDADNVVAILRAFPSIVLGFYETVEEAMADWRLIGVTPVCHIYEVPFRTH